mmetsp:Transcript_29557/g.75779  ORF Transcript_29557/g.75779 Transcript_29557/m.75779 type:complete len:335 (+) Transcript_29557:3531-4535(+)
MQAHPVPAAECQDGLRVFLPSVGADHEAAAVAQGPEDFPLGEPEIVGVLQHRHLIWLHLVLILEPNNAVHQPPVLHLHPLGPPGGPGCEEHVHQAGGGDLGAGPAYGWCLGEQVVDVEHGALESCGDLVPSSFGNHHGRRLRVLQHGHHPLLRPVRVNRRVAAPRIQHPVDRHHALRPPLQDQRHRHVRPGPRGGQGRPDGGGLVVHLPVGDVPVPVVEGHGAGMALGFLGEELVHRGHASGAGGVSDFVEARAPDADDLVVLLGVHQAEAGVRHLQPRPAHLGEQGHQVAPQPGRRRGQEVAAGVLEHEALAQVCGDAELQRQGGHGSWDHKH